MQHLEDCLLSTNKQASCNPTCHSGGSSSTSRDVDVESINSDLIDPRTTESIIEVEGEGNKQHKLQSDEVFQ